MWQYFGEWLVWISYAIFAATSVARGSTEHAGTVANALILALLANLVYLPFPCVPLLSIVTGCGILVEVVGDV